MVSEADLPRPDEAGHFPLGQHDSVRANRAWWDAEASAYRSEHGPFLGTADLVWGPEGWTEADLRILGELRGRRVLEFGAGLASAARWCRTQGADVVATDLSGRMLAEGRPREPRTADIPLVQADATALPFADGSFEVTFSAYGAVPFVDDSAALMRELARVTAPGGLVAFSTTHPIRWCFPDVPTQAGLQVHHSYFDTTPYVERAAGSPTYAEHHRTLEQRVGEFLAAGLVIETVRELPWKPDNEEIWGGWSPLRGRLVPGTLILAGRRR